MMNHVISSPPKDQEAFSDQWVLIKELLLWVDLVYLIMGLTDYRSAWVKVTSWGVPTP